LLLEFALLGHSGFQSLVAGRSSLVSSARSEARKRSQFSNLIVTEQAKQPRERRANYLLAFCASAAASFRRVAIVAADGSFRFPLFWRRLVFVT
jgi:hypothetical protein